MTALDAFGCINTKILRNLKSFFWIKLAEIAKKKRKSLAVCENMYNFAAVFQIYVNKEQCCNKE
jgi:hypothetical protein